MKYQEKHDRRGRGDNRENGRGGRCQGRGQERYLGNKKNNKARKGI